MHVEKDGSSEDPIMVTVLMENAGAEDICFKNVHPKRWLQPLTWQTITCKPGRFVQLPHRYYTAHVKSEGQVKVTQHFGRNMDRIRLLKPEFVDFTP